MIKTLICLPAVAAMVGLAGCCSCEGLCEKWSSIKDIRDSLLGGHPLIPEGTGVDDIKSAVRVREVLEPVLRMVAEQDKMIPEVPQLRVEVNEIYAKYKQFSRTDSELQNDAWTIRKLCTFVKMKARRLEVSLVT